MAHLSRPVQLGVLASAVLALAVLFALHRSGGTSSGSGSSPSAASSSSASGGGSSSTGGGSGSVYHGSAPGVEGLTRDIRRAHGAVTEVQHNAQEVQSKAAATSTGVAGAKAAAAAPAHRAASSTTKTAGAAARSARRAHHGAAKAAQPSSAATAALTLSNLTAALHLKAVVDLLEEIAPALKVKEHIAHAEARYVARMRADLRPASQATITAELHHGKTVVVLFLNPHSYDDDATAIDTVEVVHKLRRHVVAHLALASQVNSFGSITHAIQVYQTPTLLIVNPKREVTTVTGLTNEFALEQAIAEAKA